MRKKINFSFFTWFFLSFIIISSIVFLVDSIQVGEVETDAKKYKLAGNCSSNNICREILQAKIISSKTTKLSKSILIHRYYSKRVTQLAYVVRIQLPNLEIHEVIILPNLDIEDDFNVLNLYFPITYSEFDNFAEFSIPENAILNVEVWNGEPTIIFTKYINVDYVVIDNSPIFPPIESIQSEDETKDWIEYAVPTINNPLVKQHLLQDKFNQTITYITVFGLFIVGLKMFVNLK